MTHLYLIRHGQAISAMQKVVGNTRLSPLGIVQAERLRDRLAATREIQANVLISSTMLRARHTAEIIAPALHLPILFDEEFEEWRDGDAEGMSDEEYQALFRAIPFEQRALRGAVPTAESWAEFHLRIATALDHIVREYAGKTIVIVCHGGVIESTFLAFFGINTLSFSRAFFGHTRNTAITHWRKLHLEGFPPMWSLDYYNDFTHIRDIETPWSYTLAQSNSVENTGDSKTEMPTSIE